MKILGIVGSPKGMRGNTAALLDLVMAGARRDGAETEVVAIRGREVRPCQACHTCHKKGLCPQKDGFNAIKDLALAADGLVLASPNYIFHVSAQLKAFLDRCCGLVHCQAFTGKYGAAVVTSGGGDEEPIAQYLNHFLATTGAIPVGAVWATMGQINGTEFPAEIRDQALALGKRLVEAWSNHETAPAFERQAAAFKERMRSLMLWRKDEWPYEYEYWQKHHGLKA
ncbi:MAG TPA: flavodoxin family protein [bacterium]|nr:flavodoxin family protein [bacterium]